MARDFFPEEAIKRTMDWVADTILIPHFIDLGMKATGEWQENVKTRVEGKTGIISGRKYTEHLVHGLKPTTVPVKALELWVNAKFGIFGSEAKSIAWAVRTKIEQRGTSWYEKGGSDLLEILNTPNAQQRIAQYLAQQMQAEVKLYLEREISMV
jgi:hypothetical protein